MNTKTKVKLNIHCRHCGGERVYLRRYRPVDAAGIRRLGVYCLKCDAWSFFSAPGDAVITSEHREVGPWAYGEAPWPTPKR